MSESTKINDEKAFELEEGERIVFQFSRNIKRLPDRIPFDLYYNDRSVCWAVTNHKLIWYCDSVRSRHGRFVFVPLSQVSMVKLEMVPRLTYALAGCMQAIWTGWWNTVVQLFLLVIMTAVLMMVGGINVSPVMWMAYVGLLIYHIGGTVWSCVVSSKDRYQLCVQVGTEEHRLSVLDTYDKENAQDMSSAIRKVYDALSSATELSSRVEATVGK